MTVAFAVAALTKDMKNMARTSAADLARSLKGTEFPVEKDGLLDQAQRNGADEDIMETIEEMPDQEYGSMAEVEHQFKEVSRDRTKPSSGRATRVASKGGQHRGRSASR